MERFEYAVALRRQKDGGDVVTYRDLPPLITQGDDLPHALTEAADAMDEVLAAYMVNGLVARDLRARPDPVAVDPDLKSFQAREGGASTGARCCIQRLPSAPTGV
jgi:predicted RNase H-like HicB family nuclease